ncbi:MAG: ribonuclease H-like domain-containing protein [Acetatifactor sp.]
MKIAEETLDNFTISYPLERLASPEQILFIDIETTGFTARSSYLYIIGCAYYNQDKWHTIQWLAENNSQEADILNAFFDFSKTYPYLIHYNGNNFDLPYITQKCEQLLLPYSFDSFQGIDLYRRIAPYKSILKLSNCKQKTLEQYLEVNRQDIYTGGELINIYQDYTATPSKEAEDALFLHNRDDLKGMLEILPMLAYYDLFNESLRAKKVQANTYKDAYGNIRKELIMSVSSETSVPRPVTAAAEGCYLRVEDAEVTLKVPIYEEELKYFYSNYHDYYYLPAEDVALHKSVADFVDKAHRTPASAANCYTRKHSLYLPQWDVVFQPFFKKDYKSRELFFELTDEIKKDRQLFSEYASHILTMFAASYCKASGRKGNR